jgi:hypothetical protein
VPVLNPWVLLAAVVALGLSHLGAFLYGEHTKENSILAEQMRQEELVDKVEGAVAERLAKMKPIQTTVYQKATHEVVHEVQYRECIHSASGLQLVNAALTNSPAPSDSKLPGTDAPTGEHVRGNDTQAD